jgi:hypothetical protein
VRLYGPLEAVVGVGVGRDEEGPTQVVRPLRQARPVQR